MWSKWWASLVRPFKDAIASTRAEIAAAKEESRWRCSNCGENDGGWRRRHVELDICNICHAIQEDYEQKRRERIATLAAHVAGRNVQGDYRGNVDARMTAEVAWSIAEQLYELEQRKRPKPTSSPGDGSRQRH